MLTKLKNLAI